MYNRLWQLLNSAQAEMTVLQDNTAMWLIFAQSDLAFTQHTAPTGFMQT